MDFPPVDPASARARLADWKERTDKMAADTRALAAQVQDLRVTATDPVEQALTVRAQIAIVDVASCPKTAAARGVGDRLPMISILRNGVLERVLHGVHSKTRLLKDITDALARAKNKPPRWAPSCSCSAGS